ncbi:MAG: hypothetical protein IKO06_05995 [Alphaproteobacteria bacterium]|nr:hypothetical protein [Alphaproteobacteria bacterium]
MSDDIKVSKFRILFNLVIFLMPFLFIIYGAYFGYFGIYLRNKFNKTYEDIKSINRAVKERTGNTFKNFDTHYVVMSDLLPYDLEVKTATGSSPLIKNRFGGNMFFYEALNSEAERTMYYSLASEPEKYKNVYSGVSAYIILLTGLNKYECSTLAMYDWANLLPNYIGIEVSSLDNGQIYNGFTKLKTGLIPDAENDHLYYNSIKDKGYVSISPLNKERAKSKCNCKKHTCTFAIKLK